MKIPFIVYNFICYFYVNIYFYYHIIKFFKKKTFMATHLGNITSISNLGDIIMNSLKRILLEVPSIVWTTFSYEVGVG